MAKIRYTVRLYRLHDLDLITFAESHEFNVISAIYSSLSAFAKGETFVIDIPPRRLKRIPPLNRVYIKALTLDSEKDRAAVEVLSQIAPGYRNSFMKNLLRLYLCAPLSEEFFRTVKKDKDMDCIVYETPQQEIDQKSDEFFKRFEIFREGKKVFKAGKMRNTRRKKIDDGDILKSQADEEKLVEQKPEQYEEQKQADNQNREITATVKQDRMNESDLQALEYEIPDILSDELDDLLEPDGVAERSNDDSGVEDGDGGDITQAFTDLVF